MTESNKFKANGAAQMAFEASGARIEYGVNAHGNRCGVYGASQSGYPRATSYAGVGVWGDGLSEGVHGRGAAGSPSIGVRGVGDAVGVMGESAEGLAIHGISSRGRGGVFQSDRAQVRLHPAKRVVRPREELDLGSLLPIDGESGDLLTLTTDGIGSTLWFCSRGQVRDANGVVGASWQQVALGLPVTGKLPPPD